VILTASIFEISWDKQTDTHTHRKTRWKQYPRDCCRRG